MKPLASLVIYLLGSLLTCSSGATEIDGRWGLGVNVGSLISSRAEASLLRGVSSGTAWILDLSVSQNRDDRDIVDRLAEPGIDSTIAGPRTFESFFVSAGPRVRKFARPEASLSPYADVFVHFVEVSQHMSDFSFYPPRTEFSGKSIEVGGETGFGFGLEYFLTKWPVSLAAHTNMLRVRVTKVWSDFNAAVPANGTLETSHSSGTVISSSLTFDPTLQVRVYF